MTTYPILVMRALELAAQWHLGQLRKHPTEEIPYIAHPAGVGMLLVRAQAEEETVAAGILHDVIEDCGVSEEMLATATTPRVAELVMWVSEPKDRSWSDRKKVYRERLAEAPMEALAIAAADHIQNIYSIIAAAQGHDNAWSLFHASREEKLAHEHEVYSIVSKRLRSPLVELFGMALNELEQIA